MRLAIVGMMAAAAFAAHAAPLRYELSTANGTVAFESDGPVKAFQAFVPQAGSLLYGDDVDLVTVDPAAPFGALVTATTKGGTRLMWIFPDRTLSRRQKTLVGREATLTVGEGRKGIRFVSAPPVDVSTAVAFSPSRPNVLPWVVGTALVGLVAYDLSRPAPRPSPVPEPASLACLGVGVIGASAAASVRACRMGAAFVPLPMNLLRSVSLFSLACAALSAHAGLFGSTVKVEAYLPYYVVHDYGDQVVGDGVEYGFTSFPFFSPISIDLADDGTVTVTSDRKVLFTEGPLNAYRISLLGGSFSGATFLSSSDPDLRPIASVIDGQAYLDFGMQRFETAGYYAKFRLTPTAINPPVSSVPGPGGRFAVRLDGAAPSQAVLT